MGVGLLRDSTGVLGELGDPSRGLQESTGFLGEVGDPRRGVTGAPVCPQSL